MLVAEVNAARLLVMWNSCLLVKEKGKSGSFGVQNEPRLAIIISAKGRKQWPLARPFMAIHAFKAL